MARLAVNPTRMELTRLKRRLQTAKRGHKLLKDKRDELMKQFLEAVQRNKLLRHKVEESLQRAYAGMTAASAVMQPEMLEQSFIFPKQSVEIEIAHKNIMSVNVPIYTFKTEKGHSDLLPYSFATTPAELDDSIDELSQVVDDMLALAQAEKTVKLLAQEIEKTRRRVNALEYIMIPQFEETIKYITMKLDENERGNLTRLMKVKDMMLQQQIEAQHMRDEMILDD